MVAVAGEGGGDALSLRRKGRKDQETATVEGGPEFGLEAHAVDVAGGHPENRLATAQQNREALPFHRGMKTAREHSTLFPPGGHEIKRFQDDTAGALRGAEEGGFLPVEQIQGTGSPKALSRGERDLLRLKRQASPLLLFSFSAQAVLDVVVDDEVEFFVGKAVVFG